jgi:ABC-2 type transport system ATP-binding protein
VLIDDLAHRGVTVLVTTHYLDEAEHCHRIAIIQAGRLAALGTVSELKNLFAGRHIFEVRAANPVQAMRVLDATPGIARTSIFGTALHAVTTSPDVRAEEITTRLNAAGISEVSTALVSPSLEDVFLDVAERSVS